MHSIWDFNASSGIITLRTGTAGRFIGKDLQVCAEIREFAIAKHFDLPYDGENEVKLQLPEGDKMRTWVALCGDGSAKVFGKTETEPMKILGGLKEWASASSVARAKQQK